MAWGLAKHRDNFTFTFFSQPVAEVSEVLGSNPGRQPVTLIEDVRGFAHSFQANILIASSHKSPASSLLIIPPYLT
jgi:hypothetical protein